MSDQTAIETPSRGLVQAEWLASNLDRDDVIVLDCTSNIVADEAGIERVQPERATFLENHIPGAQFLDLQGTLSDPDSPYYFMLPSAESFEQGLRRFGIRNDSIVVIYSSGNPWWATRIWWMFHHFGLDNAYVLDGGLKYWMQRELPVQSGSARSRPEGDIQLGKGRNLSVDGDTLFSRLSDSRLYLVNALPPPKFRGEEPVHGGRPGHIPGSINIPAGQLTDIETGRFRPSGELAGILADPALHDSERDVVAYCGGGISATQILFALYRLGNEGAKLYDASMSEWGHRDDFPLHTTPVTKEP